MSTPTRPPRRFWGARWPVGAASPWRSSPRSTGPSAPRAPMTWVCRASTSWRASTVPSRAWAWTTWTSTRPIATTTRRRWRKPCRPSPTSCGRERPSTSGSRNGRPSRSVPARSWPRRWVSVWCPTSPSTRPCGGSSRTGWCPPARIWGWDRSCGRRWPRGSCPASTCPARSRPPAHGPLMTRAAGR